MLTKEQIEAIADHAPRYGLPSIRRDEVDDLCRLALLGLERDDAREQIRKDFAEELIASLDHCFENGTAVKRLGIEAGDEYLMKEGRLRELAALFVREMVLACRFKDMIKEHQSDERDELALRVGRAVLAEEGDETPRDLRARAADAERRGFDAYACLLRAIARGVEEKP